MTTGFDQSAASDPRRAEAIYALINDGLSGNGLAVLFQPIVDTTTFHTIGAEALVRAEHPELGIIGPDELFFHAERIGRTTRLEEWILRESCTAAGRWWQRFHSEAPFVSVNITGAMAERPELPDLIRSLRREFDLPGYLLELEMPEQDMAELTGRVWESMAKIRATGVHLGLDDFGQGMASLATLRDYPVSFVKLGRSFVEGIGLVDRNLEIIDATIYLCHKLGMPVIAKGVETAQQFDALRAVGCDRMQGYMFSPPTSADGITAAVAQHATAV
ncbi:MAG: EAL domain-containing protein [Acidimicrobiia bacterium]